MTDLNTNFRLGMFAQRILMDFNGWLLDQMGKATLGLGNQLRFAEVSVGRGRQVFYHFEMNVMVSLKTGEDLERACNLHESSSNNRKHLKLNKPQGKAMKHQLIPPFNLDSFSYAEKER